jgi:hypothetical protein
VRNGKIYVRSRDEIIALIGRSPDFASAYFLAALEVPRRTELGAAGGELQREHDPYLAVGGAPNHQRKAHDPLADL